MMKIGRMTTSQNPDLPQRILVIGSGGREHAIVRQLAMDPRVRAIYAIPGSDGIKGTPTHGKTTVECLPMQTDSENYKQLLDFATDARVDLIVIGPEQPLAEGLADVAREQGFRVFAPSKAGAKLEASKIHAKELMLAAGVRTARSFTVSSVDETLKAASHFQPPYVLKADGLAAGKGVFIDKTLAALEKSARFLFEEKGLGEAGAKALLEEFSPGIELSHLVLTDGHGFISMPSARDHKRLGDNDEGPNTGGMGVVAPIPMEPGLLDRIERDVVAPVILEIERRGLVFRGVLYFGLMLTPEGPSVLEFNTRFGDPEAQVLMALLDDENGPGWLEALTKIADGSLPKLKWRKDRSVACLVLAAEGYPDRPVKGALISGLDEDGALKERFVGVSDDSGTRLGEAAYVLHAGSKFGPNGDFITNGGRVMNVVAISDRDMKTAIELAYAAAKSVSWKGQQVRRDIGRSLLDRR
jgi:phosphoribosylamine---glycine ligase